MHSQRGFTLAELVLVIVLTGVLGVVALPRLLRNDEFAARGARDFITSSLRYAQKSAIAMRRNVCVAVGTNKLAVTYANAAGAAQACSTNTLANPATGQPFDGSAYAGGARVATPASVTFDALGRPSAAVSITISQHANPITIEVETGLVR